MKLFSLLLFLFSTGIVPAQNNDALKATLNKIKSDSAKAELYMKLGSAYAGTNLDSAFLYAHKAEADSGRISVLQLSLAYKLLGELKSREGHNEESLDYFLKRLALIEKYAIIRHLAAAYLSLATTFEELKEHKKALAYFEKALAEAKKQNDKASIDEVLNYEATFYFNLKNYTKSLALWKERLLYAPELKTDVNYIAGIGDLYRNNKEYDKAEDCYKKAIRIATEKNYIQSLSMLYSNYALVPYAKGDFKLAAEYYKKAKAIAGSLDLMSEANAINGQIADALAADRLYKEALPYLDTAIRFYQNNRQIRELGNQLQRRSEILSNLGDYKGAYENTIKAAQLKELLLNAETQKKLSELESAMVEKQKNKELQLVNENLGYQKKLKDISIAGILIAIALLILFYRNNKIIKAQKAEVEKQKHLVEDSKAELIESINYARYLQEAILPSPEFIDLQIADNFILYRPKDIVAGDFYWCEKKGDTIFIAAADSTGHGVPGALVSVVCSNALNRAVKEFGITETGKILDKARELILETFIKSTSEVKDGMDISLLSIDPINKTICWSGANNPLWYVRPDAPQELTEVKPDKQPVGRSDAPKPFTTHKIEYCENTVFYLFTDGLPDQFGGPKGKKYKYKPFAELLLTHAHLPVSEQKAVISTAFSSWKGSLDQVDDVCVIGIRI